MAFLALSERARAASSDRAIDGHRNDNPTEASIVHSHARSDCVAGYRLLARLGHHRSRLVDSIPVMIGAVVLSVLIMMLFSGPISSFVLRHPSIKVLALSFC